MDRIKADLDVLWEKATAPTQSLPEIAEDYLDAAHHAGRARTEGTVAFEGELYAGLAAPWDDLAGEVERILWDSRDTLQDAAMALKLTVWRYAKTDQAAADASADIMREIDRFQDRMGLSGPGHGGTAYVPG